MQVNEASPRYLVKAETQDVPPGYKRTEVGVIPSDWRVEKIGAIAEVGRGRVISHREIAKSTSPMYPVYSSQTSNEGIMGYLDTYEFEGEYVTWTTDGANAGTVFYRNGRFNCTNVCGTIKLKKDNTFFVSKALSVIAYRYVSRNLGNPKLMNDVAKQILIALPSEPTEQRAIAEALSDVDGLITALDKLIAKKRAIKQAAMQQLLTGKTRLPGFSGEWETKRLGDHITFLRNGVNSRAELTADGTVKYLHYGDIHTSNQVRLDPLAVAMPSLPEERARTLDRLRDGDLVLVDASEDLDGVGKSVEISGVSDIEVVAGLHTIAARFDKSVLADGFKAYLQFCLAFRGQLRRLAAGTKVYATNRSHIASVEIRLPGVEEQKAIATVLSEMDAEIAALEARRDKTKQIKQGMMQQLLTGRVRLVKPKGAVVRTDITTRDSRKHNKQINEAVIVSVLAKQFGTERYPLGRKRYTKLSYLFHRHAEGRAEGYLKKAAGPYNPGTKYGGPEKIALKNGYLREHGSGPYRGFVASTNIAQAEGYFEKWYGSEPREWLEQFRYKSNDELELLATVDMAIEESRAEKKGVNVQDVKHVISNHPEWKAKLERSIFSDANIAEAIETCRILFG